MVISSLQHLTYAYDCSSSLLTPIMTHSTTIITRLDITINKQ